MDYQPGQDQDPNNPMNQQPPGYPPPPGYPQQGQQPGYPPEYPPQGQGYPPQGQGYPPQGQGYPPQGAQGYPPPPPPPPPYGYNSGGQTPGKGKAIASLVLGIVSLVFAWSGYIALLGIAMAIVGLVLGIQARKTMPPGTSGMATAGVVTSVIALVLDSVVFVACALCVGMLSTTSWYY